MIRGERGFALREDPWSFSQHRQGGTRWRRAIYEGVTQLRGETGLRQLHVQPRSRELRGFQSRRPVDVSVPPADVFALRRIACSNLPMRDANRHRHR